MNEKGNNLLPLNKGINKEIKEREETPTPLNEKIVMEDFEKWWSLYSGDPDYSYDKENCGRVWYGMPTKWKEKLIAMAEQGIRWRSKPNDKPIFYLRDYQGQDSQIELHVIRQGTKEFELFIAEHEHKDTICIFRYEGALAYCLESDKQKMTDAGAEFLRNF